MPFWHSLRIVLSIASKPSQLDHLEFMPTDYSLPAVVRQCVLGFAGSFSSWFLYTPARVLFDAGEGLTSRLRNRVFLPEAVFLTHAHLDHVCGLPSFLSARTIMRGDTLKPLTIYFPEGAQAELQSLRAYVDSLLRKGTPLPEWKPIQADDQIVARRWIVEAFKTKHGVPSLGYRILEPRKRLRSEFNGRTPDQIRQLRGIRRCRVRRVPARLDGLFGGYRSWLGQFTLPERRRAVARMHVSRPR